MQKKKNYDVEISSILTVYIRIQYQVIVYYLVMNKGTWGGRGAEFLKSGGVVGWNSSLPHHRTLRTRHPCRPTYPCSSLDNFRLSDIVHVYILLRCSRSRHHCFLSFVFFIFYFFGFLFFGLLMHIALNFSLKLCTT